MSPDVTGERLDNLNESLLAAATLATLLRVRSSVAEVVSLHVDWPVDEIIERYNRKALGQQEHSVEWAPLEPIDDDIQGRQSDLTLALLEFLVAANSALSRLTGDACQTVLDAALEVIEALANTDDSTEGVGVDSGDPIQVTAERAHQQADLDALRSRRDLAVREVLGRAKLAARSPGGESRSVNRIMGTRPTTRRMDRSVQLLQTLGALDHVARSAIVMCAATSNPAIVLASARSAMKALGVNRSHELLKATARVMGTDDSGPLWETSSRAVMAAEAWDELGKSDRDELMRCLIEIPTVAAVVRSW